MPCGDTSGCPRADQLLQDFHNQHPHTPARVYQPTTKQQLVNAIIEAEGAGLEIRAIGTDMALSRAGVAAGATILTDSLDRHVLGPAGAIPDGSFDSNRLRDFANAGVSVSSVIDSTIAARSTTTSQPRLVFIEGGMKIRQLLADLSTMQPPLAVPAMGALSRQSVVGALATGTHGSEIDRQPLADAIRAVWLVGPGGEEWWIERTNRWSSGEAALKASIPGLCPDAQVRYDDNLFYSAITGVGRIGVVYAVVLEVERDYWIQERRRPGGEPWAPIAAALAASAASGYESPTGIFTTRVPGGVTFLQVALNPNNPSTCWVMERRRVPPGTRRSIGVGGSTDLSAFCHPYQYTLLLPIIDGLVRPVLTAVAAAGGAFGAAFIPDPLIASLVAIGPTIWVNNEMGWIETTVQTSASLGEMVARLVVRYPFLVPLLVSMLITEFQTLGDQRGNTTQFKRGRAFEVMDQTDYTQPTDCYTGVGSEYFFNARSTSYLTFISSLFATTATLGGIPGYISLRFTPQTDAYLGMERWPMSVAIEISCLVPWPTAMPYLTTAQASAISLGGIPHWGQWLGEPIPTRSTYRTSLDPFHLAVASVQDGRSTRFATAFSASQALDPPAAPLATIAATARPRVSVRALLAAAQSLVPSAPAPTSVRAVGALYKPSLRMNATGEDLPVSRAATFVPGVRVRDLARRLL
jgi:hypothetical protein